MSARAPDSSGGAGRRWWDRGRVWFVLIALGIVGALVVGWWADRESDPLTQPPEQGAQYCNTVADLQADGDITVTLTRGAAGLQSISDGFGELQQAGPPDQIVADLDALRLALDPVIRASLEAELTDPRAVADLVALLEDQTRPLQVESDRVNAYTARWCGVDLNGIQEPDEVPAPPVGSIPAEARPPTSEIIDG